MKPLSVISPMFYGKQGDDYHLSIQTHAAGLCFCVFDSQSGTYLAFKNIRYPAPVNDYNDLSKAVDNVIKAEPLLQLPYKKVRCNHSTQSCTLIPQGWAAPEQFKELLALNHVLNELDEVHHYPVAEIDAESIFVVPGTLSATLFERLGRIDYIHQSVPLVNNLMRVAEASPNSSVFAVNGHAHFVDIAFYAQQQFKLYNTFVVRAAEDLVYFLMLIAQQHKIDKKTTKVILSGEIAGYVEKLSQFFPHLLLEKPAQYRYAPELAEYADYRFALLFSLEQCAS